MNITTTLYKAWQLTLTFHWNISRGRKAAVSPSHRQIAHHWGSYPTDCCTISSRTYSSRLGLTRAGGNSSSNLQTFHFHKSSKAGHKIKYGTMPLNNTLKTFSVSYRVCFLYINLWKPQWDRLSSRSCPPTLQPVLQGAGTNPIDSLASIAAPSFMGWPTAANQSSSKKGKELVYVLRGWCTRN